MSNRTVIIQGIRGIPARHGGFETFAEKLGLYLQARGYHVIVYCQEKHPEKKKVSEWQGITRVHIPVRSDGPFSTVVFDLLSILDSLKRKGVVLTLGYNTAIFNLLYKIAGRKNLINMDGIEWQREKWRWFAKTWFYLNEKIGCLLGTKLIADHPEIAKHLALTVSEKKISTIAYGADSIDTPDNAELEKLGLEDNGYFLVIARPEPENSLLDIIRAFSLQKREEKLVVLGDYDESNSYHASVLQAASEDVVFAGAIYDRKTVSALRYHCCFYLHGHTVGGTNPSLVEAIGAGCAIIAHDNKYNRGVAGDAQLYFSGVDDLVRIFDEFEAGLLDVQKLRLDSKGRFQSGYTWNIILEQYRLLLEEYL